MLTFVTAFAVSVVVTMLLVYSSKMHGAHTADRDFSKPQKVHVLPVPRIGGVAIFFGLLAAGGVVWWRQGSAAGILALSLLGCSAPAFFAGLLHDLTESWTPRGRLIATALSAVLAFFVLDAAIRETAIPGVDWIVSFPVGALMATVLAVAGIANSVNIIDGMNGLASMCVVIMLAAVAYVGFRVDDAEVAILALAGIGAVLGFFVWNFPAGLIFLGDGGAYMLGYLVAEISILLLVRNPGEVSPIFPLLVCVYPVFETLFSIYRRRILRAMPTSMPDGIHLHSLIYRRSVRGAAGDATPRALTMRNSMTSPYLWLLCTASAVPAALFCNNTPVLALFLLLFVVTYSALYWRIVRFKSPRWLAAPATRPANLAPGAESTSPPL